MLDERVEHHEQFLEVRHVDIPSILEVLLQLAKQLEIGHLRQSLDQYFRIHYKLAFQTYYL